MWSGVALGLRLWVQFVLICLLLKKRKTAKSSMTELLAVFHLQNHYAERQSANNQWILASSTNSDW